jgi:AraC family transcriptional regulator
MLSFKLFQNKGEFELPLSLYSCGLHPQHAIYRPVGYPTLQCMICFAGSGSFQFEKKPTIMMKKGDILLLPRKVPHHYSSSDAEPWVIGYIGIEGGYVDSIIDTLQLPMLQPVEVREDELARLEQAISLIWHISEDGDEADNYRNASTQLYSILTYIASITHKQKPEQQYRKNTGAKELLHSSVQYMEQHYMDKLSLSNIAFTVGYSKQHFQRKFKEIYGINPNQYLQHLRLLKGAEWLEKDVDITVGEIAAMVGMDLNYYVRLFKREYGMSPAKYRNMIRENKRNS